MKYVQTYKYDFTISRGVSPILKLKLLSFLESITINFVFRMFLLRCRILYYCTKSLRHSCNFIGSSAIKHYSLPSCPLLSKTCSWPLRNNEKSTGETFHLGELHSYTRKISNMYRFERHLF